MTLIDGTLLSAILFCIPFVWDTIMTKIEPLSERTTLEAIFYGICFSMSLVLAVCMIFLKLEKPILTILHSIFITGA